MDEKSIRINVEQQRKLIPCEALIIYREYNGINTEEEEAVHFEITEKGDFIKPKALSINHLNDIFSSPDQSGSLEYLDSRILAINNTRIVWYEPSRKAEILFDAPEKDRQDLNLLCKGKPIWWPALLFKFSNGSLFCRALNSDKRPTPETKLFVAPLTHIRAETGKVCLPNNLRLDLEISMIANMRNCSENFYSGVFGHGTPGELTTHPDGHDGLWRKILKNTKKKFPTEYLKETEQTLQDFLH